MNASRASRKSLAIAFVLCAKAYLIALCIAILVGYASGERHPILIAFVADVAATLVIYAFARFFKNASFYDAYWSLAPIAIAVYFLLSAAAFGTCYCRQMIVISLVAVWGLRLTYNWALGWRGLGHEDWRYAAMRAKHGRRFWLVELIGIEMMPTIVVFLGCLSLYPALATVAKPWGILDCAAATITAAAILIETVSDEQLRRFAKTAQPGQIMDRGLWKYSRHPNYLGEVAFWWGLYLFALAARPSYWWMVVGPLVITALFLFISTPMMDRRNLERRPGYAERMKKVSAIIPWFHRSKKPQVTLKPMSLGILLFIFSITLFNQVKYQSLLIQCTGGLTLGISILLLCTVITKWIIATIPHKLKRKLTTNITESFSINWIKYMWYLSSPPAIMAYYVLFAISWASVLEKMTPTGRYIIFIIGFVWLSVLLVNSIRYLFGADSENPVD